ncbi:HAD-IA family hydrolase [Pseudoalteromonas luteoviolacea]|uniref:HAD-IA family hydrolase n=1 Tax=Pseudoalteromonas luteoviolacea TaxID=43657 RepID=UPI001B385793|nr:HAD-IA family hydrolase [Pseudoalteromonas luteoviolacea]MBQ4811741.1 HAD-IA family hydrolase [Pseudoalteromonas luteoviolacea]
MEYFCDLSGYLGVIFDMDGTLVDSDKAIAKAIAPWCKMHDLDLDMVLREGRGIRFEDFISRFVPHLDVHQEARNLEGAEATFADNVCEIIGANAFIEHLSRLQLPWVLATSADRENAVSRMQNCNLPVPALMITAEDVLRGKPDPEPFEKAANKLGISSRKCLVFEDSIAGVKGALAAGCDVVVVGGFCQVEHPNIVARILDYNNWNEALSAKVGTCTN